MIRARAAAPRRWFALAASEETAAAALRALGAKTSPLRRRRRGPSHLACIVVVALALSPVPSFAQLLPAVPAAPPVPTAKTAPSSSNTESDLLAPSLEGSPKNPPPFRAPGEAAPPSASRPLPAPSRVGATPIYGSPSGFGAGDTGFDSSNTPHSKRKRKERSQTQTPAAGGAAPQPDTTFAPVPNFVPPEPSQPPVLKKPPKPQIYPMKAATRLGATLPPLPDQTPLSNPLPEIYPMKAATRPGAALALPPPERFDYSLIPPVVGSGSASTPPPTLPPPNSFLPGMLPQQPLPMAATDPYAALGVRAGSFLLLPSIDFGGGYNTNAERTSSGPMGSPYLAVAPELKVQSDWERHSLTADIAGSYTDYTESLVPSVNVPFLNEKIDGRIDVTRDTQVLLEQRVIVSADNPGSPNLQAQLVRLPPNQDIGDTIGIAQQFNRLSLSFSGTFDRATYDASQLTNGQSASNADRNFDQYAGIFRFGYELDPGLKPFVEVQEDERIHDEQFDRNGLQRDSSGTTVKAGSAVDLFGSLTGEMAVGYLERDYKDPTLAEVSGVIANGALIWKPDGLNTAKLTASSQVYETIVAGASGELSRDVNLEFDHAFRSWLVGTVKAGYGSDEYVGVPLSDNRYFVSVGLTYLFTRELSMRGEVRQDWQLSASPGLAYQATTFLLGLRLQR